MKLRVILPGDSVRCRTMREAKALLTELDKSGYTWLGKGELTDWREPCIQKYGKDTIYNAATCTYVDGTEAKVIGVLPVKAWDEPEYANWKPFVDFSDLVIPDDPAEELSRNGQFTLEFAGCTRQSIVPSVTYLVKRPDSHLFTCGLDLYPDAENKGKSFDFSWDRECASPGLDASGNRQEDGSWFVRYWTIHDWLQEQADEMSRNIAWVKETLERILEKADDLLEYVMGA